MSPNELAEEDEILRKSLSPRNIQDLSRNSRIRISVCTMLALRNSAKEALSVFLYIREFS